MIKKVKTDVWIGDSKRKAITRKVTVDGVEGLQVLRCDKPQFNEFVSMHIDDLDRWVNVMLDVCVCSDPGNL